MMEKLIIKYFDLDIPLNNTIGLPVNFVNKFSRLRAGQRIFNADILPMSDTDILWLTEDISSMIGFFNNQEVYVKEGDNDTLAAGPVAGIFMNDYVIRKLAKGLASEKIIRTVDAARSTGVSAYFFSVDDVNWYDSYINGMVLNMETEKWEKRKFPFPDTVYDRGGGFSPGGLIKSRYIRDQFKNVPGIKKFNSSYYFDKWNLYRMLSDYKEINCHLPETLLNDKYNNALNLLLDKYGTVYVKKCTGSNGSGVMRVIKLSDAAYNFSFVGDKPVEGTVRSTQEVIEAALMGLKGNGKLIVQQGIDVIKYEGNIVDVRVLAQRGSDGKWQITCMPVRIANNNSPITSTRSGSKVFTFEYAFSDILKYSNEAVINLRDNIQEFIFTVIDIIESIYGPYGELGIDISIDKNGKLWFIESNAKPAKDTVLIAGPEHDILKSYSNVFEYIKYITGFTPEFTQDGEKGNQKNELMC